MTLPAVPLIGFGRIGHRRLRPQPHAFSYSGYFLMLPMRAWRAADQSALKRNCFGALAFHDADHGDGRADALAWFDQVWREMQGPDAAGHADVGGKADAVTNSETDPETIAEVWLQTFPRVLGHVFNPVSFWYALRRDGTLAAVLVEVNNTFGERHCYWLSGSALAWGASVQAQKVFHVSPFCAVQGHYRFRFHDPFDSSGTQAAGQMPTAQAPTVHAPRATAHIDLADDAGPVLHTYITGQLEPLTPASQRRALFGWPLMTWGVMVRIHWQALRLFLRGTPFHRQPVAPTHFVSR